MFFLVTGYPLHANLKNYSKQNEATLFSQKYKKTAIVFLNFPLGNIHRVNMVYELIL